MVNYKKRNVIKSTLYHLIICNSKKDLEVIVAKASQHESSVLGDDKKRM